MPLPHLVLTVIYIHVFADFSIIGTLQQHMQLPTNQVILINTLQQASLD